MKIISTVMMSMALAGCGISLSHKEITTWNEKGEPETSYACGEYMRVNSPGWFGSTFNVSFTDKQGLQHDLYGVKQVHLSDISPFVQAPMYGFDEYQPGERYQNKPDGSLGDEIKEGEIVVKGNSKARLQGGKWVAVWEANPAC